MDLMKEGVATSHPPLLDDTKYGYWKARMHAFIKSIDEKSWRALLLGWSPLTKIDDEEKISIKSEEE